MCVYSECVVLFNFVSKNFADCKFLFCNNVQNLLHCGSGANWNKIFGGIDSDFDIDCLGQFEIGCNCITAFWSFVHTTFVIGIWHTGTGSH